MVECNKNSLFAFFGFLFRVIEQFVCIQFIFRNFAVCCARKLYASSNKKKRHNANPRRRETRLLSPFANIEFHYYSSPAAEIENNLIRFNCFYSALAALTRTILLQSFQLN